MIWRTHWWTEDRQVVGSIEGISDRSCNEKRYLHTSSDTLLLGASICFTWVRELKVVWVPCLSSFLIFSSVLGPLSFICSLYLSDRDVHPTDDTSLLPLTETWDDDAYFPPLTSSHNNNYSSTHHPHDYTNHDALDERWFLTLYSLLCLLVEQAGEWLGWDSFFLCFGHGGLAGHWLSCYIFMPSFRPFIHVSLWLFLGHFLWYPTGWMVSFTIIALSLSGYLFLSSSILYIPFLLLLPLPSLAPDSFSIINLSWKYINLCNIQISCFV